MPVKKPLFSSLPGNIMFLLGMALVIAAFMISWRILAPPGSGAGALKGLTSESARHATEHEALPVSEFSVQRLMSLMADLNQRVSMLADSVTYLETKLIRAHVITDSLIGAGQTLTSSDSPGRPLVAEPVRIIDTLPPPAAGRPDRNSGVAETHREALDPVTTPPHDTTVIAAVSAAANTTPRKPGGEVTEPPATPAPDTDAVSGERSGPHRRGHVVPGKTAVNLEGQVPVIEKQSAPGKGKGGRWVINLISTPSKAYADSFGAKAWSKGIHTEQQQAVVKGKPYWRVRITGFTSAQEARAYAGTARERLGLKEVWITTR